MGLGLLYSHSSHIHIWLLNRKVYSLMELIVFATVFTLIVLLTGFPGPPSI